jgi:TFIIF-interacting CTD phosphatase-like protein
MEWATGNDPNGKENIPAGERFFNCNWDDFPKLFFLDTKHTYVYGLDPNYLYSENPELYKLLLDITNGKTDEAAPLIRERFGANYVFADAKENDEMIAKLLESGWVDMIYEDDEARILKIRDVKGDPPKDAVEDQPETDEEKKALDEEENAVNTDPNANSNINPDDAEN